MHAPAHALLRHHLADDLWVQQRAAPCNMSPSSVKDETCLLQVHMSVRHDAAPIIVAPHATAFGRVKDFLQHQSLQHWIIFAHHWITTTKRCK